jgi:hypothetical protein
LEDFKQFLPESAAQHRAQQQAARHTEDAVMLTSVRGDTGYGQIPSNQQTPRADTSRLPPMGNFAPTPTANRDNKRKRERQGPVAAPMPAPMTQEAPISNVRGSYGQPVANKVCSTLFSCCVWARCGIVVRVAHEPWCSCLDLARAFRILHSIAPSARLSSHRLSSQWVCTIAMLHAAPISFRIVHSLHR